jgi:hypothetical protein
MKAQESEQKIVLSLESLLKKTKGQVSPADLAAETGYPLQQVNDALARLIELYNARVTMDSESGKLVFKFDYPLSKRGKKSFKELLFIAIETLWKVFKVIYKASIGIVLVLYTIIFVLILIALMFGGRSSDNDSKGPDIGPIIGGLFRGLMDAFTLSLWMRPYNYTSDPYGNSYRTYEPERNKGRGFIQSVYSFVFGPDRPEYDPLEDHKEAAAFIRKNNGKITAGHIVALTGVSYFDAESRLAEYASRFGGDLYISPDGVLMGEFYDLLNKQTSELQGGRIVFYEEEVEAPYEYTGNSTGRNAAIMGMNAFNLVMAFYLTSVFSGGSQIGLTDDLGNPVNTDFLVSPFLSIGLGYFPLVFSALFFIIPMIRYFYVKRKNNEREINILRKKLIGAFVKHHSKNITLSDIVKLANIEPQHESTIIKILEKLVIELRGEINIDTMGNPVYSFKRLSSELGIR